MNQSMIKILINCSALNLFYTFSLLIANTHLPIQSEYVLFDNSSKSLLLLQCRTRIHLAIILSLN